MQRKKERHVWVTDDTILNVYWMCLMEKHDPSQIASAAALRRLLLPCRPCDWLLMNFLLLSVTSGFPTGLMNPVSQEEQGQEAFFRGYWEQWEVLVCHSAGRRHTFKCVILFYYWVWLVWLASPLELLLGGKSTVKYWSDWPGLLQECAHYLACFALPLHM